MFVGGWVGVVCVCVGGRGGVCVLKPHLGGSPQRFDSLHECDPPIHNQGLISQLTASSSIISIQTN